METDELTISTFIRYIYPSKKTKEKTNRNNNSNDRKLLKGPESIFEGPLFH